MVSELDQVSLTCLFAGPQASAGPCRVLRQWRSRAQRPCPRQPASTPRRPLPFEAAILERSAGPDLGWYAGQSQLQPPDDREGDLMVIVIRVSRRKSEDINSTTPGSWIQSTVKVTSCRLDPLRTSVMSEPSCRQLPPQVPRNSSAGPATTAAATGFRQLKHP